MTASIRTPGTPFLVLDPGRMDRNIARLDAHLAGLGVPLRPHFKTAKCLEIARRMSGGGIGPATVSTLREAEVLADAGFTDILYAVGIAPDKLARVAALRARGVDLAVILDSPEQAVAVGTASRTSGSRIPALIELDADGHRSGLVPGDPRLTELAAGVESAGGELRGVLVHAGESYKCRTLESQAAAAEGERAAAAHAAERLRGAGLACPVVSVGSTPTAHAARSLQGVTEVRAGVYVFHDLVMAGLGVCAIDDIAISVVATVIGHQAEKGWTITDAGWTAMSRDRGTAAQAVDQGFGLVMSLEGEIYDDLIVSATSQEHGILSLRPGSRAEAPVLPVGTRVRVLPNHACATAAQFGAYHLLGPAGSISGVWPRIGGW
jgi:D-serine deaminase-like pyridoxal phosphate-dependent protein